MSRDQVGGGRQQLGFPRPRGDEPSNVLPFSSPASFSPPARGRAPGFDLDTVVCLVFPARAGMSRLIVLVERYEDCFPRPRGDEPDCQVERSSERVFSPPARG